MNLYLLEIKTYGGYGTYDAMVVSAETDKEAYMMSLYKSGYGETKEEAIQDAIDDNYANWASFNGLIITKIGTTDNEIEAVYCASFNAG